MFTKSEKLTRSSLSPTNLLLEVRSVKPIQMGSFFYKNLSSTWSPVKKVILNPMERFFIASKLSWKMAAVKSGNNLKTISIHKISNVFGKPHCWKGDSTAFFPARIGRPFTWSRVNFVPMLWSRVNFMIKGESYDQRWISWLSILWFSCFSPLCLSPEGGRACQAYCLDVPFENIIRVDCCLTKYVLSIVTLGIILIINDIILDITIVIDHLL